MSAYCTRDEVDAYFGRANVSTWADLNASNDETEITDRIADAIASASDRIDAALRGGAYAIPLVLSPMPKVIVKLCVQFAGDELYSARGAQDFDEGGNPLHKLRGERQDAFDTLRQIQAGQLTFEQDSPPTGAPEVVEFDTFRDRQDAREGLED